MKTMRRNKGGRATAEEQGQAGITNFITNQMPAKRSGTKYTVGPEHHGRYAHQNGVFSKKKKTREFWTQRRATRFQTKKDQAWNSRTSYSNKGQNYHVGKG
jgi:hypothetical protein